MPALGDELLWIQVRSRTRYSALCPGCPARLPGRSPPTCLPAAGLAPSSSQFRFLKGNLIGLTSFHPPIMPSTHRSDAYLARSCGRPGMEHSHPY